MNPSLVWNLSKPPPPPPSDHDAVARTLPRSSPHQPRADAASGRHRLANLPRLARGGPPALRATVRALEHHVELSQRSEAAAQFWQPGLQRDWPGGARAAPQGSTFGETNLLAHATDQQGLSVSRGLREAGVVGVAIELRCFARRGKCKLHLHVSSLCGSTA